MIWASELNLTKEQASLVLEKNKEIERLFEKKAKVELLSAGIIKRTEQARAFRELLEECEKQKKVNK